MPPNQNQESAHPGHRSVHRMFLLDDQFRTVRRLVNVTPPILLNDPDSYFSDLVWHLTEGNPPSERRVQWASRLVRNHNRLVGNLRYRPDAPLARTYEAGAKALEGMVRTSAGQNRNPQMIGIAERLLGQWEGVVQPEYEGAGGNVDVSQEMRNISDSMFRHFAESKRRGGIDGLESYLCKEVDKLTDDVLGPGKAGDISAIVEKRIEKILDYFKHEGDNNLLYRSFGVLANKVIDTVDRKGLTVAQQSSLVRVLDRTFLTCGDVYREVLVRNIAAEAVGPYEESAAVARPAEQPIVEKELTQQSAEEGVRIDVLNSDTGTYLDFLSEVESGDTLVRADQSSAGLEEETIPEDGEQTLPTDSSETTVDVPAETAQEIRTVQLKRPDMMWSSRSAREFHELVVKARSSAFLRGHRDEATLRYTPFIDLRKKIEHALAPDNIHQMNTEAAAAYMCEAVRTNFEAVDRYKGQTQVQFELVRDAMELMVDTSTEEKAGVPDRRNLDRPIAHALAEGEEKGILPRKNELGERVMRFALDTFLHIVSNDPKSQIWDRFYYIVGHKAGHTAIHREAQHLVTAFMFARTQMDMSRGDVQGFLERYLGLMETVLRRMMKSKNHSADVRDWLLGMIFISPRVYVELLQKFGATDELTKMERGKREIVARAYDAALGEKLALGGNGQEAGFVDRGDAFYRAYAKSGMPLQGYVAQFPWSDELIKKLGVVIDVDQLNAMARGVRKLGFKPTEIDSGGDCVLLPLDGEWAQYAPSQTKEQARMMKWERVRVSALSHLERMTIGDQGILGDSRLYQTESGRALAGLIGMATWSMGRVSAGEDELLKSGVFEGQFAGKTFRKQLMDSTVAILMKQYSDVGYDSALAMALREATTRYLAFYPEEDQRYYIEQLFGQVLLQYPDFSKDKEFAGYLKSLAKQRDGRMPPAPGQVGVLHPFIRDRIIEGAVSVIRWYWDMRRPLKRTNMTLDLLGLPATGRKFAGIKKEHIKAAQLNTNSLAYNIIDAVLELGTETQQAEFKGSLVKVLEQDYRLYTIATHTPPESEAGLIAIGRETAQLLAQQTSELIGGMEQAVLFLAGLRGERKPVQAPEGMEGIVGLVDNAYDRWLDPEIRELGSGVSIITGDDDEDDKKGKRRKVEAQRDAQIAVERALERVTGTLAAIPGDPVKGLDNLYTALGSVFEPPQQNKPIVISAPQEGSAQPGLIFSGTTFAPYDRGAEIAALTGMTEQMMKEMSSREKADAVARVVDRLAELQRYQIEARIRLANDAGETELLQTANRVHSAALGLTQQAITSARSSMIVASALQHTMQEQLSVERIRAYLVTRAINHATMDLHAKEAGLDLKEMEAYINSQAAVLSQKIQAMEIVINSYGRLVPAYVSTASQVLEEYQIRSLHQVKAYLDWAGPVIDRESNPVLLRTTLTRLFAEQGIRIVFPPITVADIIAWYESDDDDSGPKSTDPRVTRYIQSMMSLAGQIDLGSEQKQIERPRR